MENNRGRPTKYRKEYDEQAYKLCLLGATDPQLADFFEVNVDSIHEWKKVHPTFSEAIKNGKEVADAKVAESLYKRALGYSHPDVYIAIDKGKPIMVDIEKHYPPDATSAIFWLKNRAPDKWRDKKDVNVNTAQRVIVTNANGGEADLSDTGI